MQNLKRTLTTLLIALTLTASAYASTRTVTLDVPGMTCPTCPITIDKALKNISGVEKVDIRFKQKQAVVTYDDAKTNVQALVKATTNAGYPSKPDTQGK